MPRAPNAVDFWRGFALVTIFINHAPGLYFERFTHRNIGFSDSAELFVFLAGWALRRVADRPAHLESTAQLTWRLGRRAFTIYCAQIVIISLAIAMLSVAAVWLQNPLVTTWHNAEAVFTDPIRANVGLVLLTHQLGYFDILPLYVVLSLSAPLIAITHRFAPMALLPVSLAVYAVTLTYQINLPTWPVNGEWFFDPLAWQLIFVLGFVLAGGGGLGDFVRRHLSVIRAVSLIIVIGALILVFRGWWPDPTKMPEPRLFFINYKTYLTPLRLIHFLTLAAVFSLAFPYIVKFVPRFAGFLSLLGRNSLNVFCMGSLLSLAAQIVRYASGGPISVDVAILVAGVSIMALTAWLTEWPRRQEAGP